MVKPIKRGWLALLRLKKKKPQQPQRTIVQRWWLPLSMLLIAIAWGAWQWFKPEPIYFALVGPMTGSSAVSGQAMLEAVSLYINQANQQGGIYGHVLGLKVFDDRANPELAKLHAQKIVDDPSIIGVLGHYSSNTSLAASPIYKQYGIPVITGSATNDSLTKDNPWYFRTIFSNNDQAALMANYAYKILKKRQASLVYIDDAFGKQLGDAFAKTSREIGLEIKNKWKIEADYSNLAEIQEELKKTYKDDKKGLLYLATHSTASLKLIVSLREVGKEITIIGSDAITTPNFITKLKEYPQERSRPGYYTEGIYATPPFLSDIAGLKAQQFQLLYEQTYHHPASTTASTYYDAILTFAETLKRAKIDFSISTSKQRQALRQALWNIGGFNSAVETTTGSLYFDNHGNVVNIIPVGRYRNGHLIPALEQFQPLHDFSAIDNVLDAALNHKIINVNNKFMHRTQVVYTGIDFIEIRELDAKNGSFLADFYLWFRFQDDFDDQNISFLNGQDYLTDLGKPVLSKRSEIRGQTTHAYRIKEKFKVNFDFSAYPLDKQLLTISLRHKHLTREYIIYVTDKIGMERQGYTLLEKLKKQKSFNISGWFSNKLLVFQNFQKTTSTLGLPERFNNIQQIAYSQFNIHLGIERHVTSFILKNLMPMIFLVILGYMVFFMPNSAFGQRITLTANVIIATSLFHLRLASNMSHVDYIILIEYIFYIIYFLSMLTSIIVIKEHLLYQICKDEHTNLSKHTICQHLNFAKQLNTFGRIFYPVFILVSISLLIYLYR